MTTVESLFWISLCAVLAPLTAALLRRRVPEVVMLLGLGVLIGPNVLELAASDEAIETLHELGLGLLFLLAGYEIEVEELVGRGGRRALGTWALSLAAALGIVALLIRADVLDAETAVSIAVTSTALGTLLPILKDGGYLGSRFGRTLLHHGAYGELGPIVAMALLLGVRGPIGSALLLSAFAVLAVLIHLFAKSVVREGSAVLRAIRLGSETSGQTPVRLVMLLLVTLGALASAFELDAALGAFAAGIILRRLLPQGHANLELKLEGLAFGFLIPIFFITSGMAIDPRALVRQPEMLVVFIGLILLVRGGGVYIATRTAREDGRRAFDRRESAAMALFASTGLPIIVAVTAVAVSAGQMSTTSASVLVAGGAFTVLICPPAAMAVLGRARSDEHPHEQHEGRPPLP